MKDRFSSGSDNYLRFRPRYPDALVDYLCRQVAEKERAWDCGTGNGQLAAHLARHFRQVDGTDISAEQLRQATTRPNVTYRVEAAESCSFADNSLDLITVAQAIHWFDFDRFFAEADRTLKPGGLLAVIGYGLIQSTEEVNRIVRHLYHEVLRDYWDPERRYIDEDYRSIPFPYDELPHEPFFIEDQWSFEQITGYLHTWSAVKLYTEKTGTDPVAALLPALQRCWPQTTLLPVRFGILLRPGKKPQP